MANYNSYKCITAATFSSVTVSDMQYWTRTNIAIGTQSSPTSEYDLLQSLISAAEDQFYNDTGGCVLSSSTWQLPLESWSLSEFKQPYGVFPLEMAMSGFGVFGHPAVLNLAIAPITEITSVQYYDPTNTLQTLTGWTSDLLNCPSRVILPANLPVLSSTIVPRVLITFQAGYSQGSAPALAQTAVKLWANHLYENRSMTKTEWSHWENITGRYRIGVSGNWNK